MFIAEVIETKKAFKPNQKDDDGNSLPLGSIEIRIGSHQTNLGQVRNIYARPAVFQRRIPLIGEQVFVMSAPVNDYSTAGIKNAGYVYFSPINGTDDLVLHAFPKLWKRKGLASGQGNSGQRKADKDEWGYTFPKLPKKVDNLQPFEGDDIYEGRFGQSIRFASSVMGDMSVYAEKPTWKGGSNTDPLLIFRVRKPTGGTVQPPSPTKSNQSTNKYTIEDIAKDDASIYITSTQMLPNLSGGFDKNLDVKKLATFKTTSQIVINAGRVVLNSVKDSIFLIGKEKAIVTGKKVILQSEKYKVDLDDLMDFLKKWLDQDKSLAQGQKQYSTASGPTGPASNMQNYITLSTVDFQDFKKP